MSYSDKYHKYYNKYQNAKNAQLGGSICMKFVENELQFSTACPLSGCNRWSSQYIAAEVKAANSLFVEYLRWTSKQIVENNDIKVSNSSIETKKQVDQFLRGKGKAWNLLEIGSVNNSLHDIDCNNNNQTNLSRLWKNYDTYIWSVDEIYKKNKKSAPRIIKDIVSNLRKAYQIRNRPQASRGSQEYGKMLNNVADNIEYHINRNYIF